MVTVVNATPHPSVVKEVICRHCGATLQYTPKDVKSQVAYDYTGGSEVVCYIKYPVCDERTYVRKH